MMQTKRKMINIADIMIEDNRWSDFGLQAIANKTFGIVFDGDQLRKRRLMMITGSQSCLRMH